jgi:hypothetical protein
MNLYSLLLAGCMRFVHKKVPKSLVFSHILCAWHRRARVSASPDRHLARRQSYLVITRNPHIYGITCMSGCTIGRVGPVDLAAMRKG